MKNQSRPPTMFVWLSWGKLVKGKDDENALRMMWQESDHRKIVKRIPWKYLPIHRIYTFVYLSVILQLIHSKANRLERKSQGFQSQPKQDEWTHLRPSSLKLKRNLISIFHHTSLSSELNIVSQKLTSFVAVPSKVTWDERRERINWLVCEIEHHSTPQKKWTPK